jgi:hypothetical protein
MSTGRTEFSYVVYILTITGLQCFPKGILVCLWMLLNCVFELFAISAYENTLFLTN